MAGTIRQRLVDLSLAIEESGAAISSEGAADETWYWAAPMWLDYEADSGRSQDLFSSARRLASAFTGDHGSPGERFIDHVQRAREATLRSYPNLGPMPTDLAEVLARMALVGPGPVSLRVLARVSRRKLSDSHLAFAACRIAWSIRSLFNGPEATELVRALYEGDPYWQRVLDYSLAGNLQSVLDEYAAVLVPSLGLLECSEDEAIDDLSRAMATSINLRTVNYAVSTFEAKKNRVKVGTERLRANFALRLGDEKAEDGTLSRANGRPRCIQLAILAFRACNHISRAGGSRFPPVLPRRGPLESSCKPRRPRTARRSSPPFHGTRYSTKCCS